MKNLVKISRESLKSFIGAGPGCPTDDPGFGLCYITGFPNGICLSRYECCVQLGGKEETCNKRFPR